MTAPSRRLIAVSVLASLALSIGAVARAGDDEPDAGGLAAGDRFSAKISFSNSWEEVAIFIPEEARAKGAIDAAALQAMRDEALIRAAPLAQDPLFVDMILNVEVADDGMLEVRPDIERVHYFDDRGRKWTLEPRKAETRARAEKLVADLAFAWRRDFRSRLEREMLEEQLHGAAVALLQGASFRARVPRDGDPSFEGLDEAVDAAVPGSFPAVLKDGIRWFFAEALLRTIAPNPTVPIRKGASFEARGIPFEVIGAGKKKGRPVVAIEGRCHRPAVGVSSREQIVFLLEAGGLVLESKSAVLHETIDGESNRFGTVRWESALTDWRPAKKSSKKPERPRPKTSNRGD